MAKGQKRSSKETRKPKKGKAKPLLPIAGRKIGVGVGGTAAKS
jgi:hypothetical protein